MPDISDPPSAALKRRSATTRPWRLLSLLALAGVALVSLMPLSGAPPTPTGTDKLVHVGLYAGLMYCHGRGWTQRLWPRLGALLCTYGVGLEWLQQSFPPRTMSLADALANCAGVSIMLLLLYRRQRRMAPVPPNRP